MPCYRSQLGLFTNLRPEDIDLHSTNARGVEVLKEYLQFAESGTLKMATPTNGEPDSPFEEAVADALRREGYRVEHQIGQAGFSIDLAVIDDERPGRYLLGIECDGATYHRARMARDRDRARQAVLERLGWTIHRIWSTDWFRNPHEQRSQVVAAIEKAKRRAEADGADEKESTGEDDAADATSDPNDRTDSQAAPAVTLTESKADSEETTSNEEVPTELATTIKREEESAEEVSISEPYNAASLDVSISVSLHEVSPSQIASWVRRIVRTESPVHIEIVARRIMDAANVTRLGRRIKATIRSGVDHASRRGWVQNDDDILSLPDQNSVPIRDRSTADDNTRDIEMVPPQEIAAAALRLTKDSFGVETEDLVQQVSRALGFSHLGTNIRNRIEDVVETMEANGHFARENGLLVVATD